MSRYLPTRRTAVKALHLAIIPLLIWFVLVEPRDVARVGPWAVQLHSVLGLIFVTLALIWFADRMWRGPVGRPGPKLSPRLRMVHVWLHRALAWGLFGVAVTGFAIGVTASRQLWAGGIVPIGWPQDWPDLNVVVGRVHVYEFYLLGALVAGHVAFHVWRHVRLRDNALRIMAPRVLHRFL